VSSVASSVRAFAVATIARVAMRCSISIA